jgi:hypothetical protein
LELPALAVEQGGLAQLETVVVLEAVLEIAPLAARVLLAKALAAAPLEQPMESHVSVPAVVVVPLRLVLQFLTTLAAARAATVLVPPFAGQPSTTVAVAAEALVTHLNPAPAGQQVAEQAVSAAAAKAQITSTFPVGLGLHHPAQRTPAAAAAVDGALLQTLLWQLLAVLALSLSVTPLHVLA